MADIGKTKKSIIKKISKKSTSPKKSKNIRSAKSPANQSISPKYQPLSNQADDAISQAKPISRTFKDTFEPYNGPVIVEEPVITEPQQTISEYINEVDTWADQYFTNTPKDKETQKIFNERLSGVIEGKSILDLRNLELTEMPPLPNPSLLETIYLTPRDVTKLPETTIPQLRQDYTVRIAFRS